MVHFYVIYFIIFYLFILDRGEGREKEGEKHQCVVASHVSLTGTWPGQQPRHVSWLGIELVTVFVSSPVLNSLSLINQDTLFICFIIYIDELYPKILFYIPYYNFPLGDACVQ